MLDNKVLIDNIRRLCDEHGIKITNLEKELGFGAGIISRWGNDADPSLSKILQIAEYFKVSIDDIVGYGYIIHDKFIEKLIFQTESKIIKWKHYDNSQSENPKQYFEPSYESYTFISQKDIDDFLETHKEISYYISINHGYVSIYACYEYQNIIKPFEIKLFIQPERNAELIEQDYTYEQLKILWLKILYSMGKNAPDTIKAEELKNSFVNENKALLEQFKDNPVVLKQIYNQVVQIDPELVDIINKLNNPDVQRIQQIFSDPKMVELSIQASKIAKLFRDVQ